MKLLIAGLAMGLLLAGAPVWADPWKDESGHGWRGKHWEKQRKHEEKLAKRWDKHYGYYDRYYYYQAPRVRHHHYRYYDYSYRYPAPSAYFSWSNSYYD